MNTEDLLKSEVSQLDAIYAACRAIDLANLKIPSKEMGFLFVAMHRMGRFIYQLGHDGSDLHSSITCYLIELTAHREIYVALTAIYALGDHGPNPVSVLEHLCRTLTSERRDKDHPIVTMRGIAFRILKRLDPELATHYIDSDAFVEYQKIVDHWLHTDSAQTLSVIQELRDEANWIDSQDNRRTKRCTQDI